MNRLHKLLFLSLLLLGCNKGHKAGMFPVGDLVQKGVPSPVQSSILAKQMFFTASGGHLVSFTQEDGIWVATVDKKLPTGFSSRVKLPVHFAQGFSVERLANYSPKEQQSLTHIERTSAGQNIIYVGRVGLQGGGAVLSYEGRKYEYRISDGILGFVTEYHKCLQCGYRREGDTEAVKNSMRFHHCNECANCLVKYKCSYSCTRICKECCGCSERIAAEKERERKRREREEKEGRAAAERRRREEESRNSSYYPYTPSYSYYTPSTSYQDTEAERKRKEEEAISQKLAEAMRQASLGAMATISNINIDVSGNTRTSNTSTVTRKQ